MPVKHVVWLKFKDEVSNERIEQHMESCRALVSSVPVVTNVECGASFTDRAGGFTHGIIVALPNRDALDTYMTHPNHIPVADALKADLADLRVMDIEV